MSILLTLPLAAMLSWVIWYLLGRTRLSAPVRLLAAVLAGCLIAFVLYWAGIYAGIYAFQMIDPVTW